MSGGEIQSISWQLDEDGGGEAKWFIDHLSHVDQHKRTFDSLDELPARIAAAIREDGRTEGRVDANGRRVEP